MTPVVRHVRLRDVALEHGCWHRVTASGEEAQGLVVQAGLEVGLQRSSQLLVVVEDLDHRRILVSEEELDRPVLRRLEARRLAEQVTKLDVLDGRQMFEHCQLLEHLPQLDRLDPSESLERRRQIVAGDQRDR